MGISVSETLFIRGEKEKIMKMNRIFLTVWAVLITLSAQAQVLFQHSGNGNPITGGWAQVGPFTGGTTAGPVSNDLGLSINAWNITDNSHLDGSYIEYIKSLSPAQVTAANTSGWLLSTTLRVVELGDPADYSIFTQYTNDTTTYSLVFGSSSTGDPIVRLVTSTTGNVQNGPLITLNGLGPGYHTYDLQASGGSNTASLSVDGNVVFTGFSGRSSSIVPQFEWGSSQSSTTGTVNFSDARLSVGTAAPEPNSIYLFLLGGIILGVGYQKNNGYRRIARSQPI
jgi:hypothetical protein